MAFSDFCSLNPRTKLVASKKQLITFFNRSNQKTERERVYERGKVRERERECLREGEKEGESFREELAKACTCLIKSLNIDN